MNRTLFILGMVIISKGIYDFQSAFFGTTTFNDVAEKNVEFEIWYYYFGFLYGVFCAYVGNSFVKVFSISISIICLCISGYALYDTDEETHRALFECVALPSPDAVDKCLMGVFGAR